MRPLVGAAHEVERFECGLVLARGLLVGEERERTVSGAPGVAEALVEVASGNGVVCELGEVGARLVAVERLECSERLPVEPDAAGRRDPFVERVAREGVRAAEATGTAGDVGDRPGG